MDTTFTENAKCRLVILPIMRHRVIEPVHEEAPTLCYSVLVWGD
jgi:hypothetical protein